MFALVAAVMFLILAIKVGASVDVFWLYLGLMFWALHFAFDLVFAGGRVSRRNK